MVVSQVNFLLSEMKFSPGQIVSYAECHENFPTEMLERSYTITITIVQFLFPFVTVAIANVAIFYKLKTRLQTFSNMETNEKRKADILKMKRWLVILFIDHFIIVRTCWLLICMITAYFISWLPLTIINMTLVDVRMTIETEILFTIFASCRLCGSYHFYNQT